VIVRGLVATFDGVIVEAHVEAVALLGVNRQAAPKLSVASEELSPTVPSGLNDGV
jgi:hypothetical protein